MIGSDQIPISPSFEGYDAFFEMPGSLGIEEKVSSPLSEIISIPQILVRSLSLKGDLLRSFPASPSQWFPALRPLSNRTGNEFPDIRVASKKNIK